MGTFEAGGESGGKETMGTGKKATGNGDVERTGDGLYLYIA